MENLLLKIIFEIDKIKWHRKLIYAIRVTMKIKQKD